MNTERVGRKVKLVFLERSLLVNFIIPPIGRDLKVVPFWILDTIAKGEASPTASLSASCGFWIGETLLCIDTIEPSMSIGF
jgi:hypothetical protein